VHWAESYHNTWFNMESAKLHHRQIPYKHQHRSLARRLFCLWHCCFQTV